MTSKETVLYFITKVNKATAERQICSFEISLRLSEVSGIFGLLICSEENSLRRFITFFTGRENEDDRLVRFQIADNDKCYLINDNQWYDIKQCVIKEDMHS